MFKQIVMIVLFIFTVPVHSASESDNIIHNELRQLLTGIEAAINTERYADLKQYFHPNLRVTTVNQNTLASYADIESYFNEWFGEGGYLQSLKMTLTPDDLTEFYNNKTMGIVRGSGIEKYQLTDGRDLNLETRWTATIIKDSDGQWQILALHLGTNFYDNAIYDEMRNYLIKMGTIATIVALLLGCLVGFYLRGRRRSNIG